MKKDDNNLNFLENYKHYAILALVLVIIIYIFLITGPDLQIKINTDLGTVGDFFGGVLNPVFGLLGLFALLATIRIQSQELKNSREELELSREELGKSANALKEQSESIKLQNFENTFFKMIDLHNEIVNNLVLTQVLKHSSNFNQPNIVTVQNYNILGTNVNVIDDKDYHGRKVIPQLLKIFKSYLSNQHNKERFEFINAGFEQEYQEIISHYFGYIYQVLKFIHKSEIANKERYSSLFRSLFSVSELELLFYHCMGWMGGVRFKPLLEEYKFLEHLMYDENLVPLATKFYDKKVFGENIFWTESYDNKAT